MRSQHVWARVVTVVFNPLIMPSIAFLILFSLPAYFALILPLKARMMIFSVVFINTAILPFFSLILLKRLGLITSFGLEKREERLYPLMLGTILVYLTYFLFRRLSLPGVYSVFLFGTSLIALVTLVITWRYAISIHMIAIGGVTGMLLGIQTLGFAPVLPWLAISILVAGIMGSARLFLKAHDAPQVYLGFLLGCGMMTACYHLF